MARSATTEPDVDRWIAKLAPAHRDLVLSVRRIIRDASPELEGTIKWGQPCYVFRGNNVCYIAPAADRVNFGFFRGADLKDPRHLLEGTGKKLRHVKVWLGTQPEAAALAALVREAVGLHRGRSSG